MIGSHNEDGRGHVKPRVPSEVLATHFSDVKESRRLFEKIRGILPSSVDYVSKYVIPLGPEWCTKAIVAAPCAFDDLVPKRDIAQYLKQKQ